MNLEYLINYEMMSKSDNDKKKPLYNVIRIIFTKNLFCREEAHNNVIFCCFNFKSFIVIMYSNNNVYTKTIK